MNRKPVEPNSIKQFDVEEETNEQKTFIQDFFKIDYVNKSQIIDKQEHPFVENVQVRNYLCQQEGNTLFKVTEIIYEDKIIRIQDIFKVGIDKDQIDHKEAASICNGGSTNHREKSLSNSSEKVRIFSSKLAAEKRGRKDRKNVVKNIIKIFLSWLEKKNQRSGNHQSALPQLLALLSHENYNNRLIKKIVANTSISKSFLAFLTDDAENKIRDSRIQDKDSHYEAINLYSSLAAKTPNFSADPSHQKCCEPAEKSEPAVSDQE